MQIIHNSSQNLGLPYLLFLQGILVHSLECRRTASSLSLFDLPLALSSYYKGVNDNCPKGAQAKKNLFNHKLDAFVHSKQRDKAIKELIKWKRSWNTLKTCAGL